MNEVLESRYWWRNLSSQERKEFINKHFGDFWKASESNIIEVWHKEAPRPRKKNEPDYYPLLRTATFNKEFLRLKDNKVLSRTDLFFDYPDSKIISIVNGDQSEFVMRDKKDEAEL
jgi:hypothetical protein